MLMKFFCILQVMYFIIRYTNYLLNENACEKVCDESLGKIETIDFLVKSLKKNWDVEFQRCQHSLQHHFVF